MIGRRIKNLREQKGYSITQLAELANISKSYLSYIERNLQQNPSIHILMKLACPLEVPIDYLLTGIDQSESLFDSKDDGTLDEEWRKIIEQAIEDGVNTDDFKDYLDFIRYKKKRKNQT